MAGCHSTGVVATEKVHVRIQIQTVDSGVGNGGGGGKDRSRYSNRAVINALIEQSSIL